MSRSVDEWVGKTHDSAIPKAVRIRVFEKYHGKCALTGKTLMPGEWDCDHITALKDGGEHRESNLHPVWRPAHREKTAAENSARAKVNRIQTKFQLPKPAAKIPSRPFYSNLKPDKTSSIAANFKKHKEAMARKSGVI